MPLQNGIIALVAIGFGVLGIGLLVFGLWPQRHGETLYCRGCGYNLTALTSECCPECGQVLAENGVVRGVVKRSPMAVAAGLSLLIFVGLIIFGVIRQFNVYPYLPASWLIREDQADNAAPSMKPRRAWTELMRRDGLGTLSTSATNKLMDICLGHVSAGMQNMRQREINYLAQREQKGRLTPAQANLFFSQMVQLKLAVRQCVRATDEIPWHVAITGYGCEPSYSDMVTVRRIVIDGVPLSVYRYGLGSIYPMSLGSIACMPVGDTASVGGSNLPIQRPGKHKVTVEADVAILGPSGATRYTSTRKLEGEFEVLPPGAADPLKRIHDPSLADALRKRISIKDLSTKYGNLQVPMRFASGPFPCGLAFGTFLRFDGQEHWIGSATWSAPSSGGEFTAGSRPAGSTQPAGKGFGSGSDFLPVHGPVDIILRGSETVARESVDLYEFWDGELVYPDLAVQLPVQSPSALPAQSPSTAPQGK